MAKKKAVEPVQITHSQAVELLTELGVKSIKDSTKDSKLEKELTKLDKLIDDDTEIEDETLRELANDILEVGEFEIVEDEEEEEEVEEETEEEEEEEEEDDESSAEAEDDEEEEEESEDDEEEEEEEEEEKVSKKKASKKAAKSDKKATKKADKEKKKPAKKGPKREGPSNKEVIHRAWVKSKQKMTADEAHELVDEAVQRRRIVSWFSMWRHGKGLPGYAKKAEAADEKPAKAAKSKTKGGKKKAKK